MAKKKTTAKKKPAQATAKKKSAPRKKAAKKAPAKRKSTRKKAASKPAAPLSVDGVLKKYEKERSTLESTLSTVRKKIDDFEKKIRTFQEQVVTLSSKESATAAAIADLETRRDAEVGQLLSKLGVSVGGTAARQPEPEPEEVSPPETEATPVEQGDSSDDDTTSSEEKSNSDSDG